MSNTNNKHNKNNIDIICNSEEKTQISSDILTTNFETLARAKGGIPKLRETILRLAVQGCLVPQDPEDEPASVLLEKIATEKAGLVKEGKIKAQKREKALILDPAIGVLPQGWNKCLLCDVIELINGRAYKRSELLDEGTPIIRIQNLNKGDSWYYSDLNLPEKNYCEKGDLLFAWSATFGPYIWDGPKAIYHYHIWKLVLQDAIDKRYAFYLLQHLTEKVKSKSHGLAMLHMTKSNMEHVEISLPPLAEQHRIVERVDTLMKLCDKLEARQKTESETRGALLLSSLNCLLEAKDAAGADTAREILKSNFDTLFDDKESIAEMRKAILQLAVQGRLAPQNPDDEPAAVLLEKIQAEKTRLVKEGKIKKQKDLPPVSPEEVPYELPEGWIWTRFGDIIQKIQSGGTPSKINPQYWDGDIFWASVKDLKSSKYLNSTQDKITKKAIDESKSKIIPANNLIICVRMGLGKIAINQIDVAINQDLKGVELFKNIDINYVYNFFTSSTIEGSGMTVKGIKQDELLNMFFPLPPLAEQHRIVERVDTLMKLCDELEERVLAKENAAERLLLSVCDGICV
ncbi:MAG: restriction endonuclease subunit S [Methanomicrobiaceae archaeon]|nr:restriction endonuclease subunit S [Methanomicrobiaceae archaeon]